MSAGSFVRRAVAVVWALGVLGMGGVSPAAAQTEPTAAQSQAEAAGPRAWSPTADASTEQRPTTPAAEATVAANAPALAGGPDAPAPSAAVPGAGAASYLLGPQDRVKVIVFQEPDLSGEFAVQSTGRVALPLLGEVQAQGLTIRELELTIAAELRNRRLLNDPKVAVDVLNARPFYILGEVQKPGEYAYLSGLSVLNAVATAGGFTPLADQTSVVIKRAGETEWKPFPLEGGLQVGPGDTVRIEKGSFYILGEVQRAGEYPFSVGMSVLRAVATAQGFTPRAERGRVLITRRGETAQREYVMRPDVPLQPGDTIVVPERWF